MNCYNLGYSHPTPVHVGHVNDYPSSFNHDGTRIPYSKGDGFSFGTMKESYPGRVPTEANIFYPSRNTRIIYDDKTFKRIKNYK